MAKTTPEADFELMFESAPISLWPEDYSALNRQTLSMFAASSQDELLSRLGAVFRDEMHESFAELLLDLWEGKTAQLREVVNYSLNGELINIHMQFAVLPDYHDTWGLVLVSLVDITARKKAEAYLEYLGKHDALTRLRNRAFCVDELNRISRKGPWPLTPCCAAPAKS